LRYSLQPGEAAFRFYAWASQIEDGRVVATDYAPDVGWLEEGDQPALGLVGPVWTLESDFNRGGSSLTLVQTLTFTADGRIVIDAACNVGAGNVIVERGTLHLDDLSHTEVPCSSDIAGFGAAFMAVLLADEIAYTIDAGVLELRAGPNVLKLMATYEGSPD
jgi:hypothetical protein